MCAKECECLNNAKSGSMFGLLLNNLCITCGFYKPRENVHTKLPECPMAT